MKYVLFAIVIFFSACSIKNYELTKTKVIIIKSPKLKFSDLGYVRNTEQSIEIELFVAGTAVEKITINHLICTSKGCLTKGGFNEDYLHPSYPSDILQNIFLAQQIYDGKNLLRTSDGFEQNIKTKNVDIRYTVKQNNVFFKDRKNKIIFKIKDIDDQN